MATRRRSLTAKSMELALSIPLVVSHRVTRMALAGTKLSERDRKEFQMMIYEKHTVFAQAWSDMTVHALRVNWALTASMFRFFVTPFSPTGASAAAAAARVQNAAVAVLSKGLAPIHRKTVSNARRLAKTKLF